MNLPEGYKKFKHGRKNDGLQHDYRSWSTSGLIAPDEKTFEYLKGKTMSPKGENWNKALAFWKTLYSDKDCKFDKEINIEGKDMSH